jgi:hypothetical protein
MRYFNSSDGGGFGIYHSKIGGGEPPPPDPNTRKRLSLKDGKRLPVKVRNLANPQVADTKDYWFLDHFVNRVKVPFGEKTEINFWYSY